MNSPDKIDRVEAESELAEVERERARAAEVEGAMILESELIRNPTEVEREREIVAERAAARAAARAARAREITGERAAIAITKARAEREITEAIEERGKKRKRPEVTQVPPAKAVISKAVISKSKAPAGAGSGASFSRAEPSEELAMTPVTLTLSNLFTMIKTFREKTDFSQLKPYCDNYYILFSPNKEFQLLNYWVQIFCKEELILIELTSSNKKSIQLYNSLETIELTDINLTDIILTDAIILNNEKRTEIKETKNLQELINEGWFLEISMFSGLRKMVPLYASYKILTDIAPSFSNIFKEIFESSLTIEDELFSLENDKDMFKEVSIPREVSMPTKITMKTEPAVGGVDSNLNSMDCYIASLYDAEQKNTIRLKYGIIRSTIDFFHDYVSEAVIIYDQFKKFVIQNNPSDYTEWINERMDIIKNKVTTSGGNVNQTACKNLWSEYAIEYRRQLNISCFPIVDFGNIGSAKIWTDSKKRTTYTPEFESIVLKLRKLRIDYFYIEAQSTPISTALIQQGFGMVTSNIAQRDAAPGVSINTAQYIAEVSRHSRFSSIWVDRIYDDKYTGTYPQVESRETVNEYSERRLIINGPNCKISKFLGLSEMKVNAFLDKLQNDIVSYTPTKKIIGVETSKTYPKINFLSLNGVIQTARVLTSSNIRQLRGQGTALHNEDIKILSESGPAGIDEKLLILSLKTYTDYCQADEIEQLKNPTFSSFSSFSSSSSSSTSVAHARPGLRVVAASSDFLASRTFSDFFATPSIYVGHNYVTVTSSDTRYEVLNQSELDARFILYKQLILNRGSLIQIIAKTLTYYQTKYTTDQKYTASAPTYYGLSNLIIEIQQNVNNSQSIIQSLAVKQTDFNTYSYSDQVNFLKQFPSTLSEFLHSLCKFNLMYDLFKNVNYNFGKIVKKIRNIENRITIDKFFEFYREIVQEITNALPEETSDNLLYIHIISLFTYSIATKPEGIKNKFLTTVGLVIEDLTENSNEDKENTENTENIINILNNIVISIDFVFKVNKKIQTTLVSKEELNNAIKTIGKITQLSQTQSEDVEQKDFEDTVAISDISDVDLERYKLTLEISQHTVILDEGEVDKGDTIPLYFPYSFVLLICKDKYSNADDINVEDMSNQISKKLFSALKLKQIGGRKTKKMIKTKRKTKKMIKNKRKTKKFYKKNNIKTNKKSRKQK